MKLSNYIMEQDINDVSVMDIYSEQTLAEFNVASALADAYIKQTMMLEYAANIEDVSEDFIQEATDGTKKKFPNVFKAVWETLKSAVKFIISKITGFFTKIKLKFQKKKIETAVVTVAKQENIPVEEAKTKILMPVRESTLEKCMEAYEIYRKVFFYGGNANDTAGDMNNTYDGMNTNLLSLLDDITRRASDPDRLIDYNMFPGVKNACETIKTKLSVLKDFNETGLNEEIKKAEAEYNKILEKRKRHAEHLEDAKKNGIKVKKSSSEYISYPGQTKGTAQMETLWFPFVLVDETPQAKSFTTAEKMMNFIDLLQKDADTINRLNAEFNKRIDAISRLLNAPKTTTDEFGTETPTNRPQSVDMFNDEMRMIADVAKEAVNVSTKFLTTVEQIFGVTLSNVVKKEQQDAVYAPYKSTAKEFDVNDYR